MVFERVSTQDKAAHPPLRTRVIRFFTLALVLILAASFVVLPGLSRPWQKWLPAGATSQIVTELPGADRPLVLLGVTGLTWKDVTPDMPLAQLATHSTLVNVSARTASVSSCTSEGWLALGGLDRPNLRKNDKCLSPADAKTSPLTKNAIAQTAMQARAVQEVRADSIASPHTTDDLLLGSALVHNRIKALAIGDGAVLGLPLAVEDRADATKLLSFQGAASSNTELSQQVKAGVRSKVGLVIVDSDAPSTKPADTLARLNAIISALGKEAHIMVVSLADSTNGTAPAKLRLGLVPRSAAEEPNPTPGIVADLNRVALARTIDFGRTAQAITLPRTENGAFAVNFTNSLILPAGPTTSTLYPTSLATAGASSPPSTGTNVSPETFPQVLDQLRTDVDRAYQVRPLAPFAYGIMGVAMLIIVCATLAIFYTTQRRNTISSTQVTPADFPKFRRNIRFGATFMASLPLAITTVGATAWTTFPLYGATYLAASSIIALITAIVAHLATHYLASTSQKTANIFSRNQLSPALPVIIVSFWTLLLLVADIFNRAILQVELPIGVQTVLGGRFYGANNTVAALIAVCSAILTAWALIPLMRRERTAWATAIVGLVGLTFLLLESAPSLGADLGGAPLFAVTFLILGAGFSQIKPKLWHLGVIAAVTFTTFAAFALWDLTRPAQLQTHLGRFAQLLIAGDASTVLWRKIGMNLTVAASIIGGIGALLLLVLLVARLRGVPPKVAIGFGRSVGAQLYASLECSPVGKPLFLSLIMGLLVGSAVNDSGLAIAFIGSVIAIPALLQLYFTKPKATCQP